MTTIAFNPVPSSNFQFNCTLDSQPYTVIVTWNFYSPRYYINIYNTAGNLIVTNPMTGSPDDFDINLVYGYFETSTLVYRVSSNSFEINP
jgi:hypothetical protein